MPTATPPDASLYHLSDVPLRTEDDVLSATARVSSGPMRPHDFLACVEGHFHSEAENDIEAALELYTDDIIFEAPALNGLNRSFSGKEAVAKFYRELWATMSVLIWGARLEECTLETPLPPNKVSTVVGERADRGPRSSLPPMVASHARPFTSEVSVRPDVRLQVMRENGTPVTIRWSLRGDRNSR